jgi:hypothetical protein
VPSGGSTFIGPATGEARDYWVAAECASSIRLRLPPLICPLGRASCRDGVSSKRNSICVRSRVLVMRAIRSIHPLRAELKRRRFLCWDGRAALFYAGRQGAGGDRGRHICRPARLNENGRTAVADIARISSGSRKWHTTAVLATWQRQTPGLRGPARDQAQSELRKQVRVSSWPWWREWRLSRPRKHQVSL